MEKKTAIINTWLKKTENMKLVRIIRSGLIHMIPVLTIGAFALVLKTLPIQAYQDAINSFAGGFLAGAFNAVYNATFGVLSVYMALFISMAYIGHTTDPTEHVTDGPASGGASIAALMSFLVLAGVDLETFGTGSIGPKSMLLAILTGIGSAAMYAALDKSLRRNRPHLFTAGASAELNNTLRAIAPATLTIAAFTAVNMAVIRIFHVESFRELIANAFDALFSYGQTGFLKGMLFVLVSSVLWFFGIHGSDALEGVMQSYFVPGLAANQAQVAMGMPPTTILTKGFFDCFVLIGGCGTAICLLVTVLVFSRNKARKKLGAAATLPMLLNINEIMVFGLPIIYNPFLLIPFILTPLICYTVAYFATVSGLVPVIIHNVEWTTPAILSGYIATGSLTGSFLQLVNISIGILVYLPFVKRMDAREAENYSVAYDEFVEFFKKREQKLTNVRLTDTESNHGMFAKQLCSDFKYSMDECIHVAYQPQFNYDGKCIGVEALLRWQHPVHGIVYPPLVMKLAGEGGFLSDIEKHIFIKVMDDRDRVLERFGKDIKISINVTGATVATLDFIHFCRMMDSKYHFQNKKIYVEVTEQEALLFDDNTVFALKTLHNMGLFLSIDDFSAGSTSLHYIKDNLFDELKLDGALVRGMFSHKNSKQVVETIIQLAKSTNMRVVAEYVETTEQRDALNKLGCNCFQGHLYSPAVELDPIG